MIHRWARFTIVLATLAAISLLYAIIIRNETEDEISRSVASEEFSINLNERYEKILEFLQEKAAAGMVENPNEIDLELVVTNFIENLKYKISDEVKQSQLLPAFLFTIDGTYESTETQFKYWNFMANVPLSEPLVYPKIDPQIFGHYFPGDIEILKYVWCDWKYSHVRSMTFNPEDIMKHSVRRDEDTERKFWKKKPFLDQYRALVDVHQNYIDLERRNRFWNNQKQYNPYGIKPNPFQNANNPFENNFNEVEHYRDFERYKMYHKYFINHPPKDLIKKLKLKASENICPIGYLELQEKITGINTFESYKVKLEGDQYRMVFDYANGWFYLSMHYKRYKFVISKNALLQLEIWPREIESQSMTQNPFFRLDLEGYPDIEMLCHNLLNN